jgi:hypothetical protein
MKQFVDVVIHGISPYLAEKVVRRLGDLSEFMPHETLKSKIIAPQTFASKNESQQFNDPLRVAEDSTRHVASVPLFFVLGELLEIWISDFSA